MSKRKNRNQSPNIPQSTLDRARQQLGVTPAAPEEAVEAAPKVQPKEPARAVEKAALPARPTPRPRSTRPSSTSRSPRKEEKHDISYIRNRLANPTRIVTEAELKKEYSYVVNDLRSMGILAAVLIAALVLIEKIL